MTQLALPYIYEQVRAFMIAEGSVVHFAFGRREPSKQTNVGFPAANRVIFMPGSEDGAMGSGYAAARNVGKNPRPLYTLLEHATVYCWAQDPTCPADEMLQYIAARRLHDAVIRALYHVVCADEIQSRSILLFSRPMWVVSKLERVYGAELSFEIEMQASIVDEPWTTAPASADVGIEVDDSLEIGA